MGPSIDAADLYFQHSRSESWVLEDGIVKDGSHSIEQGVGVRAMSGEKTGFAYSDEIVLPRCWKRPESARAIAQAGANGAGKPLAIASGARAVSGDRSDRQRCPTRTRSRCCARSTRCARSRDPRVKQVIVSIAGDASIPC